MKYRSKDKTSAEGDMTPMIDIVFQLVIFFMLTLNFSQDEQSELIKLPASELAKPAVAPVEKPITLQLTKTSRVLIGGDEVPLAGIRKVLLREKQAIQKASGKFRNATVIIRADQNVKTGKVQELIRACQETGFEKFVLRAKNETGA
ncbi:MAG: biopolymer transporter ExbD [Thermoguttaceae bacterium]|jgi:biopolymer transport protein ExbD